VGRCRTPAGRCHPFHADCDPAYQQAVIEPCTGQAVSGNRAPTCTLGHIACREERTQRIGTAAVRVLGNLCKASLKVQSALVKSVVVNCHGIAYALGIHQPENFYGTHNP